MDPRRDVHPSSRVALSWIIPIGGGSGAFTPTAELLFQTVGYRWAENLREFSSAEIDRFLQYTTAPFPTHRW